MKTLSSCRRPKFSLWTLAVFVTMVCCYAAGWQATESLAHVDVRDAHLRWMDSCLPLGDSAKQQMLTKSSAVMPFILQTKYDSPTCSYYFWFFGYVARLPDEC